VIGGAGVRRPFRESAARAAGDGPTSRRGGAGGLVAAPGALYALAALGLLVAGPAPARAAPASTAEAAPRTIRVTGEGRVSVSPDVARFSVGVDALAKTLAAASAEAGQRMRAALDALQKEGVASKDVRTTRYDVSIERPWKDGKPGLVTGYRVSNAAEVKVRDLGRLGAILDRVTAAGSNAIGALRMERDDPTPERLQALAAAYQAARAKAEALAKAAGVQLGEVLSVSESSSAVPRPMPMAMMRAAPAAEADVPIAEGELVYAAQVDATFAIR
jgi:hypothetical protein